MKKSLLFSAAAALLLSACAPAHYSAESGFVNASVSDYIFLKSLVYSNKTIYLDAKDLTNCNTDANLSEILTQKLSDKGYKITKDAKKADYIASVDGSCSYSFLPPIYDTDSALRMPASNKVKDVLLTHVKILEKSSSKIEYTDEIQTKTQNITSAHKQVYQDNYFTHSSTITASYVRANENENSGQIDKMINATVSRIVNFF